jgi:peptide-methionine (S)-S-oxide reductase
MKTDTVILAGGCFRGVQEFIRKLDGVISTEVGYTGGRNNDSTHECHPSNGEAIKVKFVPEQLSYRELLNFFFQIHDQTTVYRQETELDSNYRSAIFWTTKEQMYEANQLIDEMDSTCVWPGVIATEVKKPPEFRSAETEHQDYLQRNPNGCACYLARPNWQLPK